MMSSEIRPVFVIVLALAVLKFVTGASDLDVAARIVSHQCNQYVNQVSTPYPVMTLDRDSPIRYVYALKCPLNNPFVVGGMAASKNEFPHMAALGYLIRGFIPKGTSAYRFMCGGTLISEQFILTAAHCINDDLHIVRIGVTDLDDSDAQNFFIAEKFIHEEYSLVNKYNDVALLRLKGNVTITLHVRPACLATERTEQIQRATVTGWGKTSPSSDVSAQLNKVSLDVPADRRQCSSMYNGPGRHRLIQRQICAGSKDGNQDACQGDSGGPLQVFEEAKCRYHVIGVVSFGKICGSAEYGIYTRVSRYLDWIVEKVWPDEWSSKDEWADW
ncbi:serine protease persephone-like [Uranotaenia lowii]|uniref:serine protease persephone-like n=1 Tax=Uranotaenia lowii TaxID=190385 RepID=UPI0024795AAA|nr:serine protease persephone-like [Uranotaenia lowii]